MIIDALYAWVLSRRWTGDTSAHVTFFTREQGILYATFRGGRTPKRQSHLQAFTPLWLSVNKCHDWHYVKQLEMISATLPLQGDHLFSGLYVNELLYHALQPCDAHPELYEAYECILNELSSLTDKLQLEAALRRFESQLLVACGYEITYTYDVEGAPIQAETHYHLLPGVGFIPTMEKGIYGAYLLAIAHNDLSNANVLRAAKYIMRHAIDHALEGKTIKARELYRPPHGKWY